MDEKRLVMIGVGAVLVVSSIIILSVNLSGTLDESSVSEPEQNWTTPLLLISMDGFRSDYLFRYAPTLRTMAVNGVTARYLMPSYPTVTFPNHYTIVTGLYPESHGIVTNYFYDPDFKEIFTMNTKEGKWWGGEPIWNTLTRQNKISATFFWPGSDSNITGLYPTYWRPFDKSVPFEDRVDQVVKWLAISKGRPDFVSLYFDEPDGSGHEYGPDTSEVNNQITYVDGMMSRLLAGLRRHNLEDKVNIIVLADHGMAVAGKDKVVDLTKYVPNIEKSALHISYGAFTMIKLNTGENVNGILNNLSCPSDAPHIRAFDYKDLPTRLHYSNNKRIGDIVLDFDTGYYTKYPTGSTMNGEHGYDNHLLTMSALFIATGPDFQKGKTLEPFQNIEIYNLMCLLTDVDPAPNNGTEGSLYAALIDPPPLPDFPQKEVPPPAEMHELSAENIAMANCTKEITQPEKDEFQKLNITKENQEKLRPLHFPWGVPSPSNLSADIILMYHNDHITGYSQRIKMPLWTSFTVTSRPLGTPAQKKWYSDVRLNKTTTQTCNSYNKPNQSIKMTTLFPPNFSIDKTLPRTPYIVSNAVPSYNHTLSSPVDHIYDFLESSTMATNIFPFNVVLGPVFDDNRDSFPDDFSHFSTPQIPSDFFLVITRCKKIVSSLNTCEEDNLDAITFIAPIRQTVNNNCKNDKNYASFFLSTVHDVERATGFTFYPAFNSSALRLQLSLKIHRNLWII